MSQTGVVAWSQTAASNATADVNVNWAEGMAPSQVNDSARAEMSSVAKFRDDIAGSLTTAGTATAYTLVTNQVFSSLTVLNGQTLAVRFHATNGAAPTLAVDGLTAKPIQIDSTNAVASYSLRANGIHHLTYDNSLGVFIVHHGHALIEAGRIAETARSSAPAGWLMCDGSAVSRTTYADLFAAIGTTFGTGNGSTTFNVPDRRGRVGVGVDSGSVNITGATALALTQGEQNHTLGTSEMPVHNHTATDSGHLHGIQWQNAVYTAGGLPVVSAFNTGPNTATTNGASAVITVGNAGSGGPHNNMQPTITMNYQIKI